MAHRLPPRTLDEEMDKLLKLGLIEQTLPYQKKLQAQLDVVEKALVALKQERIENMWLREWIELEPLLPSEALVMTMPSVDELDSAANKKKKPAAAAASRKRKTPGTGSEGEKKKAATKRKGTKHPSSKKSAKKKQA